MLVRFCLLALLGLAACHALRPAPVSGPDLAALRLSIEAAAARHPSVRLAVAVRDPSTGAALDLDADRSVHAASTMKLPVMIELFRQVEAGRRSWDDPVPVRNTFRSIVDGSEFSIEDDSDDGLYGSIGGTVTVRDLVERAITRSSNLGTNLLIDLVTADSVQATMDRLGASDMRVLRGVEDLKAYEAGLSNTTTARALATLLVDVMEGRAVSPQADAEMVDIMLAQEFNETIPAGLPPDVRVAHKTGWISTAHHDAAIVYPGGAPPYVLVILMDGTPDHDAMTALGSEVAGIVHAALRGE